MGRQAGSPVIAARPHLHTIPASSEPGEEGFIESTQCGGTAPLIETVEVPISPDEAGQPYIYRSALHVPVNTGREVE